MYLESISKAYSGIEEGYGLVFNVSFFENSISNDLAQR